MIVDNPELTAPRRGHSALTAMLAYEPTLCVELTGAWREARINPTVQQPTAMGATITCATHQQIGPLETSRGDVEARRRPVEAAARILVI
jgi:hypothetical protein